MNSSLTTEIYIYLGFPEKVFILKRTIKYIYTKVATEDLPRIKVVRFLKQYTT
jgi:hypothetical protein